MRILFLGGTQFLGRHAVDAALARGHAVTVFTRGRTPNHWGDAVTVLTGDRDPKVAPGLDALRDGTWDAVIDTSGYVPRVVRASAEMLTRSRRAVPVRVVDFGVRGRRRRGTRRVGAGRARSTIQRPKKSPSTTARSRPLARTRSAPHSATSAIIVRPGLIVGPHDSTDRFGYWVARFRHPALLGDRPAQAVVPAPQSAPVQFIDARDLADWMIDLVEAKQGGTFNATSPAGHWTWGSMVDALRARRRRAAGRVGRRGAAARTQGGAVDGPAAVDPVDVRRRGRLHGIRLPPRAGGRVAHPAARGDHRRHGRMAGHPRQRRRMESGADRGSRAGNPRLRSPAARRDAIPRSR